VWCGAPAPEEICWSNAHFIPRSHGGLGDERNGLTLCPICHRKFDQTTARKGMRVFFRDYLMDHYEDWNEEDLVYRKEIHGR
jgi:5-methylcytosine-specific restriction endonuclease McrA